MRRKNTLLICLTLFLFFSSCESENEVYDPTKESIFDRFARDSLAYLSVETDFEQLFENKFEGKYQPAKLTFEGADGHTLETDIELSARGVTRKKICSFPPIKFRFSKEELASADLQDFHTLKLVTHCQDSLDSEQLILKEYLAYRILNLLTEHSFHVQLARVHYVDTKHRYPPEEKYAFLIENNKEMAARLGGELLDEDEYKLKTINKENYNLLALFQCMIGNTDWNLSRFHNIKLVLPKGDEVPLAVPYDFDYSGLVNAPYAVPYASLPIANVRERFLQWRGTDVTQLAEAIDLLQSRKEAILELCQTMPGLKPEVRGDVVGYLAPFFDLVQEPLLVERELMRREG